MLPLAEPVAHRLDLRDYQRDAIAAIRTAADEGCRRQLLVLPTGAGKTVTFGALAHEIGGETLILAHRDELIRQAVDKLRMIWPDAPCGVVKASENDVHAQVVVASVQTLARERRRRQLGERSRPFDLVIVDECFPAGTLVGGRPIESLRPGDMVPSWDEATGRPVEAPVVAVMRREASALVRVTLDDRTIFDCTPNHPVMTAAGWCPAGALPHGAAVLSFTHHDDANRHDLHRMRDTRPHRHEATPGQLPSQWSGVLLDVVPRPMGVSIEFAQDGSDEPALRVAAHDRTEPDAQRREPREDEGHTAGDRPPASRAWRQRHRPDRPAGDSGGAARLADGGHLPDRLRAHQGGTADPLQDRHREPGSEGRGGGRRGLPFLAGPPSVGCSQGRVAHWRRVAGVEVLERRGDGRPGEGRGGNPVYNLEVAGTHTYLIGDGIVVHNCHHAAAKSYRDVLDYVGAGSDTTPWVWQDRADRPLLLGVTATPDRGDRVGLDAVFERIVFHRDMLWGIQSGFLADLRGLRVVLDIDLHKVKVRSGDYGDAELAEVLHNVGAPGIAVRAWHDHAEGRKTLVFTPTVALAHEMADSFLEAGVSAGVVHGEMDDRDRRDTLARFAAGDLQVLANCAVLTEGFDEPSVGCVILARPTRSRALYVQMLGRGTRRHPGKADCLVIDMVDAAGDHDLVTMPELFGLPLSALRKATVADAVDRVRADAEARQEAAAVLAEEINLWDRKFREAKLNWLQTAGAWVLATEGGFVALEETTPGWWRAVIKPRRGPFRLLVADVDLETAMSAGEDHVRRYAMRKALRARQSPAQATALVRADAPWRRRAPSEKMLGYAARVGASVAGMRTAGEVADAIDAAKAARDLARLPVELA